MGYPCTNVIYHMLPTFFVLIAASTAARAAVPADAQRPGPAPRLRVAAFVGRARISMEGKPEQLAERSWPLVPSGATVNVLKGRALFETDLRAKVLVKEGCGFFFASHDGDEDESPALHLLTTADCKSPLQVELGGEILSLGPGAGLSIAESGRRELTVRSEGGVVRLAKGDARRSPDVWIDAQKPGDTLDQGDVMLVHMPAPAGFDQPASSLNDLRLVRRSKTELEARRWVPEFKPEVRADAIIAGWRPVAQRAAEWAIEKYGAPDEISEQTLVWNAKGPWKRIAVHCDQASRDLPLDHWNILEETIALTAPKRAADALDALRLGVHIGPQTGELTAISEAEETNFLALNVAAELLRGQRTMQEARDLYYHQISLWNAGRSSPYLQGLASVRHGADEDAALPQASDEARR